MNRFNLPLGDTGRANDRVIRVTNVHYDATPEDILEFFGSFEIIDQIRDRNVRTRTYSVVYVLFATQTQRIEAEWLSGHYLLDRRIRIQPAPTGTYTIKDDHSGFVRKDEGPPIAISRTTRDVVPHLGEQLEHSPMSAPRQPIRSASHIVGVPDYSNGDPLRNDSKVIVWGAAPKQLQESYESTHTTLLPISSDKAQLMAAAYSLLTRFRTANRLRAAEERGDPIAWSKDECGRGVPVGIDTTKPPNDHNWNLSGNNSMFTPEDWNNFQRKQLCGVNGDLGRSDTVAARINREGGLNEDDQ